MALETGSYISDLVATNPVGTDNRLQGDDHIRLLKATLQATFPSLNAPMTASGKSVLTGTPAAARTALGSTTVGDALFTTSTAATARTTLDVYSKAETDTKLDNPAFSAYVAANQTISSSTYTKVNFDTEEFDLGSCYDTTNKRWTPNKAGYYFVSANVNNAASNTPTIFICGIYKNGTIYKQTGDIRNGVTGSITATALIYMNGTTDYVEAFGYMTATVPLITGGAALNSSFLGYFVRA